MNHTPGPWKFDKSCDGFRTVSNGSLTICTVGETDLFPQVENDALLIAAAPELLEALQNCIEWLDRTGESVSEGGKEYEYVTKAREAITKAKGKG